MPLVLFAPRLLDADAAALAACEALQRLAARARAVRVDDAEQALLQALGCDLAAAPLAALGAGLDAGDDWVARADPIATQLSHDDVRIVARVDDLADDETRTLLALLDRHFADDGLAFAAPRRDAWFVRARSPQALATIPLPAAIDRPLRDRLPAGAAAGRWRRWWTEVQMLLHEHPLSERSGLPVHALWFAGGGSLAAAPATPIAAFATEAREGDIVRGLARRSGGEAKPLRNLAAAFSEPGQFALPTVVAADPIVDAGSLRAFAEDVLRPALAAFDRGRSAALVVIADGRAVAARWDAHPRGLLRRWLARGARFAVPGEDA